MRRLSLALLALLCAVQAEDEAAKPRFMAIDVFVDAGATPLAAYQVEVLDEAHASRVVGVEGGDHAAFAMPPYYDPKALSEDRIVVAAFNTSKELPVGRARVARIHMRVDGGMEPGFLARLVTAGSQAGNEVAATVTVEKHR